MTNRLLTVAASTLLAISVAPFANVASAMPVANAIVSENTAPTDIETVQWRGRAWRGGGWGFGAGLLGGAIIGGMLASPYYYGSGPDYSYPGPYYPGPYYSYPGRNYPGPSYSYPSPYYLAPGYVVTQPGNAVAYCMQRFRSYDLRSGTYLGYDGYRHPCP
jgi:hypothetical protein